MAVRKGPNQIPLLKRLLVVLALFSVGLLLDPAHMVTPAHAAYQPGAVVQLPNIAAISSKDLSNTPQVSISGYHAPNDGGQGIFILMDTPCTPDGGSCIADSAGNTFQRTNLNGDFRQWGLTKGSAYDAIANPTTVLGASTIMNTAIAAVTAQTGLTNFDTAEVSLFLDAGLTIPSLASVGCSLPVGGQLTGGVYSNVPGSLVLKHGFVITTDNTIGGEVLHNCVIIPQMLINPSVVSAWSGYAMTYPPLVYNDLEALRGNMILAGDTGVYINNARAVKPHDLYIYGFNTAYHYNRSDHMNLDRLWADGNIGLFGENGGGQSDYSTTDIEPFLTKQANSRNISCNPTGTNASAGVCNEEYWNIASIAASPVLNSYGRPNCRMTLNLGIGSGNNPTVNFKGTDLQTSSLSALGDPITYPAWIANLFSNPTGAPYGATGCLGTGPYAISVISSTATGAVVDVLESEYSTGATKISDVTTFDKGTTTIRIASGDIRNLQVGMIVAGTGIPVGATIASIGRSLYGPFPYAGYITELYLSAPTTRGSNCPDTTSAVSCGDESLTFDGGTFSSANTCNGAGKGGCLFISADERVYSYADNTNTGAAGLAVSMLPMSRGHPYAAAYAVNGTPGTRSINSFGFGHHYEFAMQNANNCVFIEQHNDDSGELDDYGNIDMDVEGTGSFCVVSTNGLGKAGVALIGNLYSLPERSTSGASTVSGSISTAAGITLTLNTPVSWPSDMGTGVAQGKLTVAVCQTTGADTDCSNQATVEYMYAEIVDTTHLLINARGRFFTAPTVFTTGAAIIYVLGQSQNASSTFSQMTAITTDRGLNIAEIDSGGMALTNIYNKAASRSIIVGHNATDAVFTGMQASSTAVFYEDATALSSARGCGNSFLVQQPWECNGSVPISPVAISASTILSGSAHSYKCDATSGTVTLTVPAGSTLPSFDFEIAKIDGSSNLCVITMSGSDTIGGAAGAALSILNDVLKFKNDNGLTNWVIQ